MHLIDKSNCSSDRYCMPAMRFIRGCNQRTVLQWMPCDAYKCVMLRIEHSRATIVFDRRSAMRVAFKETAQPIFCFSRFCSFLQSGSMLLLLSDASVVHLMFHTSSPCLDIVSIPWSVGPYSVSPVCSIGTQHRASAVSRELKMPTRQNRRIAHTVRLNRSEPFLSLERSVLSFALIVAQMRESIADETKSTTLLCPAE